MKRRQFPIDRKGLTRKIKACNFDVYVTVNCLEPGLPGEMFVTLAKEGTSTAALYAALATAISIGLQHGVPWATFRDKFLGHNFEPNDYENPSILHAVMKAADELVEMSKCVQPSAPNAPPTSAELSRRPSWS